MEATGDKCDDMCGLAEKERDETARKHGRQERCDNKIPQSFFHDCLFMFVISQKDHQEGIFFSHFSHALLMERVKQGMGWIFGRNQVIVV